MLTTEDKISCLSVDKMQLINHTVFDEGYRQNILDGSLQTVIDAIENINTRAQFDYNYRNGYCFLQVNQQYDNETKHLLQEEGFFGRYQRQSGYPGRYTFIREGLKK